MKTRKSLVLGLSLVLWATPLLALDYSNAALGFTARLPDGLDDLSSQVRIKTLVCRGHVEGANDRPVVIIYLQDLGGTLGRQDRSKVLSNSPKGTLEKTTWKGFDIDLFRVAEDVQSVPFLTFNAQVPLKPHAIQLSVFGPAKDEARLRQELQTILATVEGPTNWLAAGQTASGPRQNLVAVVIGLFALIAGRLRITRYYGLKGTGARVAGFMILAAGIALPTLTGMAFRLMNLRGASLDNLLIAWIVFNCALIWGIIFALVKHYGNGYARVTEELVPVPVMVPDASVPPPLPQAAQGAPVIECHMCRSPIPPEQQATVKACPNCGADLTRRKR